MSQKKSILNLLQNGPMKQGELAEAMYGDKNHSPNIWEALKSLTEQGIIVRSDGRPAFYSLAESDVSVPVSPVKTKEKVTVPAPSVDEVEKYLKQWDELESYHLQEDALDKLFSELAPDNTNISEILLKVATLNDFYSTNIFSVFPVAKHILSLDIDKRLKAGDVSLVGDIQKVTINGVQKNFYSFATKYCSHHNPLEYPIYDSYVEKMLKYFRNLDGFADFKDDELKDYIRFKGLLVDFRKFYCLEQYNLKEIDKYIWQLGKEYFPKNYGKK